MSPISREFGIGNVSAPAIGADVVAVLAPAPQVAGNTVTPADCDRPVHSADIAQSRLFEEILVGEIAELRDTAASAEVRWRRLRDRSRVTEAALPDGLVRLHARIAEAERLLGQLRCRFGYGGDSLRVI